VTFIFTPNTLIESAKLNSNFSELKAKTDTLYTSFSMKSATNGSSIALTNTSQDLVTDGVTVSLTATVACKAFVSVSLGVYSTTDFEFQPEIRLGGTIAVIALGEITA